MFWRGLCHRLHCNIFQNATKLYYMILLAYYSTNFKIKLHGVVSFTFSYLFVAIPLSPFSTFLGLKFQKIFYYRIFTSYKKQTHQVSFISVSHLGHSFLYVSICQKYFFGKLEKHPVTAISSIKILTSYESNKASECKLLSYLCPLHKLNKWLTNK